VARVPFLSMTRGHNFATNPSEADCMAATGRSARGTSTRDSRPLGTGRVGRSRVLGVPILNCIDLWSVFLVVPNVNRYVYVYCNCPSASGCCDLVDLYRHLLHCVHSRSHYDKETANVGASLQGKDGKEAAVPQKKILLNLRTRKLLYI
jgi:hypothetical protein